MTPDGNKGPMTKPKNTIRTTEETTFDNIENNASIEMARMKYRAVALRTPTLSVNGPNTSLPTAIPAQKPDEERPAR
ncbi:hypothetical protein M3J09_007427 [Ascochyta lentis]